MKKSLLLGTCLLLAASASATDFTPVRSQEVLKAKTSIFTPTRTPAKAPVKHGPTADGFELAFCGEMYSWYYAAQQNKCTYQNMIVINEDIATALAGNQVTDVTFSCTLTAATQKRQGSIFVAEISDEGELVIVAEQEIEVTDSYQNKQTYDQTASFDEPYTIKEGTAFVFGVIVKGCVYTALGGNVKADAPIGVDGENANAFAGLVFIYTSGGEFMLGIDMGEDVGTNLYLKANTVGSKKSLENVFNIQGAMLGAFTLPILVNGEEINATVGIDNMGTNDLTTMTYTAQVGENAPVTKTVNINVPASESKSFEVPLPELINGKNQVKLTIDEVNGVAAGQSVVLPYLAMDNQGYDRKFVVEEATGDWCGWCPRGIVAFEEMGRNYPDVFTGIAVHGDDDLQVDSYMPYLYNVEGFPSCVVNRDYIWDIDPSTDYLEFAYEQYWSTQRSPVKVDVEATYDAEANTLSATATTEFAINDSNADYALAFAIIQDNIPGVQTNYYAGGNYGECGGWETKGKSVAWYYNHVARDIFSYDGIEGSIPASVQKGQTYTFTQDLSLANVKELSAGGQDITGVDKTAVIALVLDKTSGTVLNAAQVDAADYKAPTGIADALKGDARVIARKGGIEIAGSFESAEVFTAAGLKAASFTGNTASLPAGLYLVRVDGKTTKVIVK